MVQLLHSSLAHPVLWSIVTAANTRQPNLLLICTSKHCRHKTGTAPCICCFHVMRHDNMPHRYFGCKCLFLRPKILLSQHLTPSLDSGSPAYQSSPFFFWQLLTFTQPAAHPVFLLKGSYLCTTVLAFTLFYVLHFGRCSPLILHTLCKHVFQVSPSKGTVENKCVLRRPECGLLEPTQAGSC